MELELLYVYHIADNNNTISNNNNNIRINKITKNMKHNISSKCRNNISYFVEKENMNGFFIYHITYENDYIASDNIKFENDEIEFNKKKDNSPNQEK